jgi:DNA (cytosine-5)-methyltransferase 1
MIKVGSDFSGVGAFNQALMRLGIDYEEVFACDMDKYARQTFIHNYGEPKYFPTNVYDREIPKESLDIYMTSPPCQAFSLAGKRLGKDDKRGILFFNSHEFIKENKPRYFIFENVKGLLSDDGGKTFSEWVNMLGGKSVNGNPVIFPYEESVPYHIYWKVLNAKDYGVPQNRERVFIIGIRDDEDNNFTFPKEEYLTKRLKDVLENDVDKKYFLSERLMSWIDRHRTKRGSSNKYPLDENDVGACMVARYGKNGAEDPYIKVNDLHIDNSKEIKVGTWRTHNDGRGFREVSDENCPTIPARAREDGSGQPVIIEYNIPEIVKVRKHEVRINELQQLLKKHKNISIKEISKKLNCQKTKVEHWFRTDTFFSIPDAEYWLQLKEIIGIDTDEFDSEIMEFEEREGVFDKSNRVYDTQGISPTLTSTSSDEKIINKVIQLNPSKESNGNQPYQHNRVYDTKGIMTALDTDSGRKSVMIDDYKESQNEWIQGGLQKNQPKQFNGISPCLTSAMGMGGGQTPIHNYNYKIRRLTPRECFRLMDFNDTFTWICSDSQAYKQAGNSIVVGVLAKIINKLKL